MTEFLYGRVCPKHKAMKGKRYLHGRCVECSREQNRRNFPTWLNRGGKAKRRAERSTPEWKAAYQERCRKRREARKEAKA
jgi:hypothetical protein